MKKLIFLTGMAVGMVVTVQAALRRMDALTVTEGASVEFAAQTAVGLKSANTSVATVAPPEGGRSTLTALRLGTTEITLSDARGPFAVMPVNVVPTYWETLVRFFEDDPEIRISVSGDKVIITGQTANPDTLSRVKQAVEFDEGRILTQVSYSTASVALLVKKYLAQIGHTNIAVSCIGRNICLKGKLFDQKAIDLVTTRAKEFLVPFAGIGVNTDGLKIVKQRIILTAEFLEYNVSKAQNLGIKWPTAIEVGGNFNYGWDWSRDVSSSPESQTETSGDGVAKNGSTIDALTKKSAHTANTSATVGGADGQPLKATINLLKRNDAAKTLYKTTLATQSGEEVEFQNGGTRTLTLEGTFSGGDTKDIEYGFIVKALPIIIDETSVNLSLSLDNKTEPAVPEGSRSSEDIDLKRYQTKSKYIVRPGETIVMSGFNAAIEDNTKDGVPYLAKIPWLGPRLFGNTEASESKREMLLVVTVNWALENEHENSVKIRDELKTRSAEVEMPW